MHMRCEMRTHGEAACATRHMRNSTHKLALTTTTPVFFLVVWQDACCGVPGAESLDDPNRESQKGPNGTAVVPRWVAQLDFTEIQQFKPFDAASLRVTPLPVLHGEDLVSLGFSFGERELVCALLDSRPSAPSRVCSPTRCRLGTEVSTRNSPLTFMSPVLQPAPHHHPLGLFLLIV